MQTPAELRGDFEALAQLTRLPRPVLLDMATSCVSAPRHA